MAERRGSGARRGSKNGDNHGVNLVTSTAFSHYVSEMDLIGHHFQTVGSVLFAVVRAVSRSLDDDMNQEVPPNEYISYSDNNVSRLPTYGESSLLSTLLLEASLDPLKGISGNLTVEKDNDMLMTQLQCALRTPHISIDGLDVPTAASNAFKHERQAHVRSQINRLVNIKNGFPLKPLESISERGVKESELLTFSSLAATDLYKYHQLYEIETLIKESATPLPNFTGLVRSEGEGGNICKRRYFRELSALNLSQILARESVKEPVIISKYYPMSDQLLYALCWPPPHRRMNKVTCAMKSYLHPTSKLLQTATARRGSFGQVPAPLTTRKKEKTITEILEHTIHDIITLTPAGKALVRLQNTTSTNDSWMIVYLDGCVLGHCRAWNSKPRADEGKSSARGSSRGSARGAAASSVKRKSMDKAPEPAQPAPAAAAPAPAPAAASAPAAAEKDAKKGDKDKKANPKDKKGKKDKEPEPEPAPAPAPAPPPEPEPVVEEVVEEPAEPAADARASSIFFCQTEDGVRILSCNGPAPEPCLKPDGFGTVMINVIFPSGLNICGCSNGSLRFSSTSAGVLQPLGKPDPVGQEHVRYIISGGVVVRTFSGGLIAKELLHPDGTRELVSRFRPPKAPPTTKERRGSRGSLHSSTHSTPRVEATSAAPASPSRQLTDDKSGGSAAVTSPSAEGGAGIERSRSDGGEDANAGIALTASEEEVEGEEEPEQADAEETEEPSEGFLSKLLAGIARGWRYVRLGVEGYADFYYVDPGAAEDPTTAVRHPTLGCMRHESRDAETGATVITFTDDRIVVQHANGQRVVTFPDQTSCTTHPDGSTLLIAKKLRGVSDELVWELPAVEVDTNVDRVCGDHARGLKIPINKGGEQTRFKAALPDGSALMIKYNTSFIASSNGSVKLVRRDRSRIVVKDSGELNYFPASTWDDMAMNEWLRESADSSVGWVAPSGAGISNLSNYTLATGTVGRGAPSSSVVLQSPSSPGAGPTKSSSEPDDTAKARKKEGDKKARNNKLPKLDSESLVSRTSAERDILVSNKAVDLRLSVNFNSQKCFIQDCEHNSFEISLQDPLHPVVSLAGEVTGLLPTAVTDNPIEPRVFIISRTAEATEVLPVQAIADVEKQVDFCPDVTKSSLTMLHQPAELGNAVMQSYFWRCRLGHSGDVHSFTSVFGERPWLQLREPATAALTMIQTFDPSSWRHSLGRHKAISASHKSNKSEGGTARDPNSRPGQTSLFQSLRVEMQMPLSAEGYRNLLQSIEKWNKFKAHRAAEIDRFNIVDDRSEAELELEERVRAKVKQAYKMAKAAASKRKEKERELRASQAAIQAPTDLDLGVGEKIDEGADGEEEDDGLDSEEDEPQDGEEAEIRAAFESYSVVDPKMNSRPLGVGGLAEPSMTSVLSEEPSSPVLPSLVVQSLRSNSKKSSTVLKVGADLRGALIQLLNNNVSMAIITQALQLEGLSRTSWLTLSDFRIVYFRVNNLLHPPRMGTGAGTAPPTSRGADAFDSDAVFVKDSVPILPMKSVVSHGTEVSSYWKSSLVQPEAENAPQHNGSPISRVRPKYWEDGTPKTEQSNAAGVHEDHYAEDGFLEDEVRRAGAVTVPAGGLGGMLAQGSALRAARTANLK